MNGLEVRIKNWMYKGGYTPYAKSVHGQCAPCSGDHWEHVYQTWLALEFGDAKEFGRFDGRDTQDEIRRAARA